MPRCLNLIYIEFELIQEVTRLLKETETLDDEAREFLRERLDFISNELQEYQDLLREPGE